MNRKHQATAMCANGGERKIKRLREEEVQENDSKYDCYFVLDYIQACVALL